jgi:creatinine amidohydrolase/Fe(II)-dependent formamide hydrolase-like protein
VTASSSAANPLEALVVIDRLDVGPVTVERDRLVMPYTVMRGGSRVSTELVYRWEEPVFEVGDPVARNLASMIGAQVALNYGLFARRIVFHGPFDDADRRFLADMAENTSREIYVKKFLEPNPFLVGEVAELPVVRPSQYTQAEIEVADGGGTPATGKPVTGTSATGTPASTPASPPAGRRAAPRQGRWRLWETSPERHAVMSSGGKDSLLTHGLLSEISGEVHPIFVNESGRHWLTALNAYRHFQTHVAHTARVWTNSDRVFAWFLRQLPFIRQDFADVRSDEYPIRLWTVAVFLFGALPLLRKRGVGRLLIGDEYDTSARSSFKGITHYDGLYDQSRYFDNALSRYFMRKGWSIVQFSVLRPLSEMLIEKVLAERYPELLRLQTSCHATHKEGERVRPCGRCEKCRRIVGMLSAIGADPGQCGYSAEQIERCLEEVARKGVHQETPGARHLLHGLAEKGLVEVPRGRRAQARPHPEILALRIDAERSPLNGIPMDLRRPLYGILLEHAAGAVRRRGSRWEPIELLDDPGFQRPYPFETDAAAGRRRPGSGGSAPVVGTTFLWGELAWPDAETRLAEVDVALLPVGAIEQHGPHLPLDTDAFDADYLAQRVAEACSEPKPLVLPLVSYGVSYHHEDFKGTISISNASLAALVYDIGMSAARNGIRKLLIINGHGGNSPTLNDAAQRINRDSHIFVAVDTGETSDVDVDAMAETPNDVHAGEIETSTTLAVRPHLVRTERIRKVFPKLSSRYLSFSSQRGVAWYAFTKKLSPTGVMGDPTRASAEKGQRMWQAMIAHLVALTEDLKAMTLEEIYQRRY